MSNYLRKTKRGAGWRTAFACLALLLCGGCDPDPPPWESVLDGRQVSAVAPRAPETASSLVVYLDTSASMAGYVSPDRQGQTVYSRSLQELRNLVSIATPPLDVTVRRVDAAVGAPNPDTFLTQASVDKAVYNGRETNIAGAVGTFSQPPGTPARPEVREVSNG
ncbi:MAG TPA: hypothetical protein VGV38_10775, partial [Pyrinomonadaceae bacterium]|nr:hypothetical protein [Pyrinomonadaceae bacterium]